VDDEKMMNFEQHYVAGTYTKKKVDHKLLQP
jgi:hypothetical protein